MMQVFRNPKNVRLVSLLMGAIFVVGAFVMSLTQTFGNVANAAAADSAIGVVNYKALVRQNPAMAKVQSEMNAFVAATQKELDAKTADMAEAQRQDYFKNVQQSILAKEKELMDPILAEINAQIKVIAEKKGLTVVVDQNAVVFGGVDITGDVARNLQKAGK